MTTDLAVVADPRTGEMIDLHEASNDFLAALVAETRDQHSRLNEITQLVSQEMHSRFDRQRKWTTEAGGYRITGRSDALVSEWDADALMDVLSGMVVEGEITEDALQRALRTTFNVKVMAAGVNALLKSPSLAGRIEACRTLIEPRDRRLIVERLG